MGPAAVAAAGGSSGKAASVAAVWRNGGAAAPLRAMRKASSMGSSDGARRGWAGGAAGTVPPAGLAHGTGGLSRGGSSDSSSSGSSIRGYNDTRLARSQGLPPLPTGRLAPLAPAGLAAAPCSHSSRPSGSGTTGAGRSPKDGDEARVVARDAPLQPCAGSPRVASAGRLQPQAGLPTAPPHASTTVVGTCWPPPARGQLPPLPSSSRPPSSGRGTAGTRLLATGAGGGLLNGSFDEGGGSESFQEALNAWRAAGRAQGAATRGDGDRPPSACTQQTGAGAEGAPPLAVQRQGSLARTNTAGGCRAAAELQGASAAGGAGAGCALSYFARLAAAQAHAQAGAPADVPSVAVPVDVAAPPGAGAAAGSCASLLGREASRAAAWAGPPETPNGAEAGGGTEDGGGGAEAALGRCGEGGVQRAGCDAAGCELDFGAFLQGAAGMEALAAAVAGAGLELGVTCSDATAAGSDSAAPCAAVAAPRVAGGAAAYQARLAAVLAALEAAEARERTGSADVPLGGGGDAGAAGSGVVAGAVQSMTGLPAGGLRLPSAVVLPADMALKSS